jgi:hypothetical protein
MEQEVQFYVASREQRVGRMGIVTRLEPHFLLGYQKQFWYVYCLLFLF